MGRWMLLLAGNCARQRTYFSCLAKKSRQKKATLPAASLRFAPGNLRCSRAGCRRGTHCALRASFKQPRRIRARCGRVLRRTRAPRPLRSSAHPEGRFIRAIAALGPGASKSKAERSDGLFGMHRPSGRAEKRRAWGGRGQRSMPALRALTRCGCPNEVNAVNEVSSAAPPQDRASQVARSAAQGHGQWGRLFFGSFLWRDKERDCAAGRTSRPAEASNPKNPSPQPSPQRGEGADPRQRRVRPGTAARA